jgi:hypothetical protein
MVIVQEREELPTAGFIMATYDLTNGVVLGDSGGEYGGFRDFANY